LGPERFGENRLGDPMQNKRRLPPLLLVGIGFIIGLFFLAVFSAPSVAQVFPAPDEQAVPATARIQIEFSQPMDTRSLVAHFNISPDIEGRFYWDGNLFTFQPESPLPNGEQVTVKLRAGARSQRLLSTFRTTRWQFTVGQPRLVYLWPSEGKADLYTQGLDRESTRVALTQSSYGVEDFNLSPEGSRIAYTAITGDGGTSLHLLDLTNESDRIILECSPEASCRSPVFSPDGRWLAFEEHQFVEGIAGRLELSRRQIGLVSLDQASARLLLDLQGHDVWGPDWSPTGLLIYYDEVLKAVVILDVQDKQAPVVLQFIPNGLGQMGSWSPDGEVFVIPEIVFTDGQTGEGDAAQGDETFYSHLYRVELESGRTVDISPGEEIRVEDASPVFHPQGELLAFTRKYLDESLWTPGRQIWILDADTQGAESLTTDPNLNYSALTWSPEGDKLAFMRRSPGDLNVPPDIGWIDLESGEESILIQGAFLPGWIP
jgi:Tol biopolymer transport system component